MDIFYLRMLVAARRQLLRDLSDEITQQQIDEVLDQIITLQKLIEQLEKES